MLAAELLPNNGHVPARSSPGRHGLELLYVGVPVHLAPLSGHGSCRLILDPPGDVCWDVVVAALVARRSLGATLVALIIVGQSSGHILPLISLLEIAADSSLNEIS